MSELATTAGVSGEAGVLAVELGQAFGRMVRMYEEYFAVPHDEAVRRAAELPAGTDRALTGPPDQVSFLDLHRVADPDRATARWEEVKQAALDELRTGHRAARAVETGDAGSRAQFLALRAELAADWQPRTGIARQLIDTIAQAQACYLTWLQVLTIRTASECAHTQRQLKDEGKWRPPRLTDAEAVDQAAAMVDRFNRIVVRTLRALADLRRPGRSVVVQRGGQVNVAENQVNVAAAVEG